VMTDYLSLTALGNEEPVHDWLNCSHAHPTRPRARTIANGKIQYRRQCLDCGMPVGNVVAKAVALQETRGRPLQFDEALFNERKAAAKAAQQERWEAESAEWWDWYNRYLQSAEWEQRRRKVFERCNGICEGCRATRAVHVHHRTYDNVGNELLYQLVGLCQACHEIAHSENPNRIPDAVTFLRMRAGER
jgi:5-methylcytosine-specific restriction endonuclease McrA